MNCNAYKFRNLSNRFLPAILPFVLLSVLSACLPAIKTNGPKSDPSLDGGNAGAQNHAPVATDQSFAVNDNATLLITLAANDEDNQTLEYSLVDPPSHGILSGTAPDFIYTPSLPYNGTDSFTFKVNDGSVDSETKTVVITINHVNHAPVASAQSVSTTEEVAKPITLSATDSDGDTLTYSILVAPAHGVLSGSAPNITYTPNAQFHDSDSFTFKVNDGSVDSEAKTIAITVNHVNHAPVASAQSVTTDADAPKTIVLSANDVDGDALTYTLVTAPTHGFIITTNANNFTYTPADQFLGSDTFTFRVGDDHLNSEIASIAITVNPYCNGTRLSHSPFAAGAGTLSDPYTICTAAQMQAIGANLSTWDSYFALMSDLDLSAYTGPKDAGGTVIPGAVPFNIIGTNAHRFHGTFDGNNHTISNFSYSDPTLNNVGLFSVMDGGSIVGTVKNLGLINSSVRGATYSGGMIGVSWGKVSNCYASGTINIGANDVAGGLIGYNGGSLSNSYATTTVSGHRFAGGLVGWQYGGSITYSHASGTVTGSGDEAGGLAGASFSASISKSYATGNVSGRGAVGGLTGRVDGSSVMNSYASSSVTSSDNSDGGLIGINFTTPVSKSYSTGSVSGPGYVGGLVGYNVTGSLSNSFWDTVTSNQSTSDGGTGLSTALMKLALTYNNAGWDSSVWTFSDGVYPTLAPYFGIDTVNINLYSQQQIKLRAVGPGWNAANLNWADSCGALSRTSGTTVLFTAPAMNGICTITLSDNASHSVSGTITVSDPSHVGIIAAQTTISFLDSTSYTILGGTNNFVVSTDHGTISNTHGSGTFSGNGFHGVARITVLDQITATSAYVDVTVSEMVPVAISADSTQISFSGSANYTVSGGTGQYSVATNLGAVNNSAGSGSFNGDGHHGTATITVTDTQNSNHASVEVIVNDVFVYFCDSHSTEWMDPENWFSNDTCASALHRIPVAGDFVVIQNGIFTDTPIDINLSGYRGAAPSDGDGSHTTNLVIAANGTLSVSDGDWGGSTYDGTVSSVFSGSAVLRGLVQGDATFADSSSNSGTVYGNIYFALVPGDISTCGAITQTGTYVLTTNLAASSTCFVILADDVILDGHNYSMEFNNGAWTANPVGVLITGNRSNVTIENFSNLTDYNWGGTAIYASGTLTGSHIENNVITGDTGFSFAGRVSGSVISGNSISASGNVGIYIDSSYQSTFSNNLINAQYGGIYYTTGGSAEDTFSSNTISSNYNGALYFNDITGTAINGNSLSGFYSAALIITGVSETNTFDSNVITNSYYAFGIEFNSSSTDDLIANNQITSYGHCIYFYQAFSGTPFSGVSNILSPNSNGGSESVNIYINGQGEYVP